MAVDANIIKALVNSGRAGDLHQILLGISPYCPAANQSDLQDEAARPDGTQHRIGILWTLAIHHLEFIAKHGTDIQSDPNEPWRCAHPDEFNEWLALGAPGLSEEALAEYINNNKIN